MTRFLRRRWRWVVAASVVVVLGGGGLTWMASGHSRPVTVGEAQKRAGATGTLGAGDTRPRPGVYLYAGTGRDKLSLPPLSQPQGPTMPATVTLTPDGCWTLRIDYSTQHYQEWDYCRRNGDLLQDGGRFWQRWNVGPLDITNSTTLTCSPPAMVLPATKYSGQTWTTACGGTSTAVKGRMTNTGTYRYLGRTSVLVGASAVEAEHFVQTNHDEGSQVGTERYETWLAPGSGLPVKLQQDIEVTTTTAFGRSTYTQTGALTITSLQPAG